MKKIFLLKGLDCPHCAEKIENEVSKLVGVSSAKVNLIKQTLTAEIDGSSLERIVEQIEKIVKALEPDVKILEYSYQKADEDKEPKLILIRFIAGAVLFVLGILEDVLLNAPDGVALAINIIAYIILGADVIIKAFKNIFKGRVLDENFLMGLSTAAAFLIGEYHEAVAVMLFYQVGEYFQDLSVRKSRKSIVELLDIRPNNAAVLRDGNWLSVKPNEVEIGELILVKSGEIIALDGVVEEGNALIDTKALTGESVPKTVSKGDDVLSGCINEDGLLKIRVTKPFDESTVSKIIELVESSAEKKAITESFISKFAGYYTPAVVLLAVFIALIPSILWGGWQEWIRRGLVFLVISCPCALVLSVPLAFFSGIGACSKKGILVKGGNYLEALSKLSTVVFDKTGTLTRGTFSVAEIIPSNSYTKEELLEYAAKIEANSLHPIARSVVTAYGKELDKSTVDNYKEISGLGVEAELDGSSILVGNKRLMENNNIELIPCKKAGTKVYLAVDGSYAGCILISDEIKTESKTAIAQLRDLGVKQTVMLTGDNRQIADEVAGELLIDKYYAELLPNDKVRLVEEIQSAKKNDEKLAFVGDGINDAPVIACADIGVAMGGLGSDAAIEAADVVLMTDEVTKLAEAVRIARYTKRRVFENIVFSLTVKLVFLILGAFGVVGMWEAVFADVGVALIAVLNSMSVFRK